MLDPRTSRTRSWNLEIKIKRSTFNLLERVSIPFKDQKMYSPAGRRVPRTSLTLNEIQTHSKMHSPAGWRVSHASLGACLLSRPEAKVGQWTRCFRTLCWKPRYAGRTSTLRPSFGNMSPEGRNNVVQEFRRGRYSSQMICTQLTQRIVAVSSRGCILSLYCQNKVLKELSQFACERNATSMPVKEKGQDICGKDV